MISPINPLKAEQPDAGTIDLKEAIYKTIVFFDIFSYPLTAFEIWQYLSIKSSLREVVAVLRNGRDTRIEDKNAYYFLKGRGSIIKTRGRRYNFSDRKMKRAVLVSKLFVMLPWIKMIAVGNVIGSNNLRDNSDIDFFIVTEKKRLWLTRFFTTFITKILLLRPRVNDVRDKICLSFYLSEEDLNLKQFQLKGDTDIYFLYWLACLVPIYGDRACYNELLINNNWLKEIMPNWEPLQMSHRFVINHSGPTFFGEVVDLFIGGLEKQAKSFQLKILPNDLKEQMNRDSRVVINDLVLKLHVKDRRSAFRSQFNDKLNELKGRTV